MRTLLCQGVVLLFVFVIVDGAGGWPIVQLTDNDFDDTMPQVSGNNVAWTGGSGSEIDVFFYDGAVHKLTDGSFFNNGSICLDGNRVAWTGWKTSGGSEVFLFDGQTTQQITNNNVNDNSPALWNGGLAWLKHDGSDYEVFNYDGTSAVRLTNDSYNQYSLDGSGKYVGWVTNDGSVCHVMRYDGQAVTQVMEDPVSTDYGPIEGIKISEENVLIVFMPSKKKHRLEICMPEGREEVGEATMGSNADISGYSVVWDSMVSTGDEVFLRDENGLTQITENGQECSFPNISGSLISWSSWDGNDLEVFLYDGKAIMQVTDNDSIDSFPQLSGSTLTWQHWDGNDWEIQMVSVPEPSYVFLLLVGMFCIGTYRALLRLCSFIGSFTF